MDNRLVAVVSVAAGVVIGKNWKQIVGYLSSAKEKTLELAETAKEKVSDTAAKIFSGESEKKAAHKA